MDKNNESFPYIQLLFDKKCLPLQAIEYSSDMKVIVDDKIPYIKEAIEGLVDEVLFLPGAGFTKDAVKDADALIVRTRTLCNRELLEGSQVKFIATATIGYDHIDVAYCREAGITWTNCPGCNAGSVEQYVRSSLLLLEREKGLCLKHATIGVVGVGHVGSRVVRMAESLGMKVLQNDPPRADRGEPGFVDLDTIARECDIITFHTPLHREGPYRTFHLADEAFFAGLKRCPYLINSSRGEVVDTASLLAALSDGRVKDAVIDTWEEEPHVHPGLLKAAFIATPHIAGYSADGKANATRMSLEALCRFFGIEADFCIVPPDGPSDYDPTRDSEWLKASPEKFEWFRGHYPIRREA